MHVRWVPLGCGMLVYLGSTMPGRSAEVSPALFACRDIKDSGLRLSCFDRELAKLSSPAAVPAATSPPEPTHPAASTARSPALTPQQTFGLPERTIAVQEVAAGTRASDATKIQAHILQVAAAPDQRMVFTLDNDQVWRQLAAEGDLLAKQGDAVKISRALFGSYWLQLPSGRGCKVTRVR